MTPSEVKHQVRILPQMPYNRQLLSVPFVGKDTPSLASEFSHPDVIIGLTILGYRYQGMRFSDFTTLLEDQVERLDNGYGPPHQRQASKEFVEWVEASGGRVRGTRRRVNANRMADRGSQEKTGTATKGSEVRPSTKNDLIDLDWVSSEVMTNGADVTAVSGVTINPITVKDRKSISTSSPHSYRWPPDVNEHGGSDTTPELDQMLFHRIWPLELIDIHDKEQVDALYRLMWREPMCVWAHLTRIIFPITLQHSSTQLSASGQEIGGDALFPVRLGFSGTPSDLLPIEFGRCEFEPGTDGEVVHLLTSPGLLTYQVLTDNECKPAILISYVARWRALNSVGQCANALIDTGALITGFSNLEVATMLLDSVNGLPDVIGGVVYLDEGDRQMVLVRDGFRVMRLAQCGLALENRFTFYDQVHTTGQDVKHCANAIALLTIGKDMTFRDYAQGAWRMRGFGKGQTLHLIIPPAVADLIEANQRTAKVINPGSKLFGRVGDDISTQMVDPKESDTTALVSTQLLLNQPHSHDKLNQPHSRDDLEAVCSWLVVRLIESGEVQRKLLCVQNINNLWRKRAFWNLMKNHAQIGTSGGKDATSWLSRQLNLFKDKVDFTVPATVPFRLSLHLRLTDLADAHHAFLEPSDLPVLETILTSLKDQETGSLNNRQPREYKEIALPGEAPAQSTIFDSINPFSMNDAEEFESLEAEVEQEQEQEEEQEEEQEQEQEKEQEQEQEAEKEEEVDDAAPLKYSKQDEAVVNWPLSSLSHSPTSSAHTNLTHFYPLSTFSVPHKLGESPKKLQLPPYVYMSVNHYKPKWSLNSHRRLKNIIIVMEWIPDITTLTDPSPSHITQRDGCPPTQGGTGTPKAFESFQMLRFKRAFDLFDPEKKGKIKISEIRDLLRSVDIDVSVNVGLTNPEGEGTGTSHGGIVGTGEDRGAAIVRIIVDKIHLLRQYGRFDNISVSEVNGGRQGSDPPRHDLPASLDMLAMQQEGSTTPAPGGSGGGGSEVGRGGASEVGRGNNVSSFEDWLSLGAPGGALSQVNGGVCGAVAQSEQPLPAVGEMGTGGKVDQLELLFAGVGSQPGIDTGMTKSENSKKKTQSGMPFWAPKEGRLLDLDDDEGSEEGAFLGLDDARGGSDMLVDTEAVSKPFILASDLSGISTQKQVTHKEDEYVTFEELTSVLRNNSLFDVQRGRFFVVVTLEEAEALRSALHVAQSAGRTSLVPVRHGVSGSGGVAVGLRVLPHRFTPIDTSPFFRKTKEEIGAMWAGFQQQTSFSCLRFVNSEVKFTQRHLHLLLRALQGTKCVDRQNFFLSVRRCRRRNQRVTESLTSLSSLTRTGTDDVGRVFVTQDDMALMNLRAVSLRLSQQLKKRNMSFTDGFRAMDKERKGRISIAQLFVGLKAFNIYLTASDMRDMATHIALPKSGSSATTHTQLMAAAGQALITEPDFMDAFCIDGAGSGTSEDQVLSPTEAMTPTTGKVSLEELSVLQGTGGAHLSVSHELIKRVKCKLVAHSPLKKVWQGTIPLVDPVEAHTLPAALVASAGQTLSIWRPDHLDGRQRGVMKKNRERVCLGHFVTFGPTDKPFQVSEATGAMVLEVSDPDASPLVESLPLRELVEALCPHPSRYKLVWQDTSRLLSNESTGFLCLWSPVPPTHDFVAMGLVTSVCTGRTVGQPALTAVRCIPRKWTHPIPHTSPPRELWREPVNVKKDEVVTLSVSSTTRLLYSVTARRRGGYHAQQLGVGGGEDEVYFDFVESNFKLEMDDGAHQSSVGHTQSHAHTNSPKSHRSKGGRRPSLPQGRGGRLHLSGTGTNPGTVSLADSELVSELSQCLENEVSATDQYLPRVVVKTQKASVFSRLGFSKVD
eukprot:GHVN01079156.1.p1 GENE.GHVN01079156.1~~GHVN01079156.1.p1  ORF type:complete len:2019 (-),score=487.26 GHVN01079156.1:1940-7510(-)